MNVWSRLVSSLCVLTSLLGAQVPGVQVPGVPAIERPIPYPIDPPGGWADAVEAETRTEDGRPGADYWTDTAHYEITAELDPATARVQARVTMSYQNRGPKPCRRLVIHLRQNAHKEGNMRNRYLEITGGVVLNEVVLNGEPLRERSGSRRGGSRDTFSVRGTVLTIPLARSEALEPNGEASVTIDWSYRVPKRGAPRNGHDGFHTYYLGYWYPQFAVRDDVRGWVADQYRTNAEFYMGYASYDVRFTAPKGWLVRATGELQNAADVLTDVQRARLEDAKGGRQVVNVITPEDLEAGDRVTRMDNGDKLTWHYAAKDVRDFAVSVSDRYLWDATHAVVKDRDGRGKDGVAMIHSVYRQDDADGFDRSAEYARHTIEYMSGKVHPYPWPHMTVCGGVIGGGMEFPMMTICGNGNRGLVAHELIHMWFPMLVGSNEKRHAWQDEGFTSFFTTWTTAAFDNKRPRPDRANGRYKATASRGESGPLMTHGDYYPDGSRSGYGFASYAKSSAVLFQLCDLMGEDLFFRTFRQYAADWAFKHPYPHDFFNAFEHASGRDLDWYFRTWYYETWTLDQSIESVRRGDNDGVEVVVADLGRATYPTLVRATYDNGDTDEVRIDVAHWLSGKKTKVVNFGPGVQRIELNPDVVTLDLSKRNDVWEREQ